MEKVLIVDDDVSIVESLKFALRDKYDLYLAYDSKTALDHYLNNEIAVTILDLKLGNENGMELYSRIREINHKQLLSLLQPMVLFAHQ